MKKVTCTLLLLCILICSCATLPEPRSELGVIDYTPLIKEGIYVTESNSVNFEYTAVASLIATERGGWVNGMPQRPSTKKALSNIIQELKRVGANGIINLTVLSSVEMVDLKTYASVITVKGMAIKIPENGIKMEIVDTDALGYIDGIKCKIAKRYNNGAVVYTSKELTPEQIRKAKNEFKLNGRIRFNLEGNEEKGNAYAGIDDGFIILYKNNEFIKL
jgi:uncharacterized protein YbjQ (UPF0145 family)